MNDGILVRDFLEEFRALIGDTDCSIPFKNILVAINVGLRRMGREKGLEDLFLWEDTFELASVKGDNSPSSSWNLNTPRKQLDEENRGKRNAEQRLGMLIDMKSFQLLDTSGCELYETSMSYLPYRAFRECIGRPESNSPGTPSEFTLQRLGGSTRLIFDRPINRPFTVNMYYAAFHPRLRTESDVINVPYEYQDILLEITRIQYYMESMDHNAARAAYEDYDHEIDKARELLAANPSGLPFRKLNGSF